MIRRPVVGLAHRRRAAVPRPGERGTGLVSSIFGVAAFLAFLLLAVQLLSNLYATSVVTSVGYDAARQVAAAPTGGSDGIATAQHQASDQLGAYGAHVRFDWSGTDDDTVRLRMRADNPRLLGFGSAVMAFTHVDRTIVVRRERFR